jgi:hypothetical protein
MMKFDWSCSAEWLENSPSLWLQDGTQQPVEVKILLTPGNHTNPFATTVTNVLQGPTGATGPDMPLPPLANFPLNTHYLRVPVRLTSLPPYIPSPQSYMWYPYWNTATTEPNGVITLSQPPQRRCYPTNQYQIFLLGCQAGVFDSPQQLPAYPENIAIWNGLGQNPALNPTCEAIGSTITPNLNLVQTLTACSAVTAFIYVPPNTPITPVHYTASFYQLAFTFNPITTPPEPISEVTETYTWSATTEWITNYLATNHPTNPGMYDYFTDTFGLAGEFLNTGFESLDTRRMVPLLIGANQSITL